MADALDALTSFCSDDLRLVTSITTARIDDQASLDDAVLNVLNLWLPPRPWPTMPGPLGHSARLGTLGRHERWYLLSDERFIGTGSRCNEILR